MYCICIIRVLFNTQGKVGKSLCTCRTLVLVTEPAVGWMEDDDIKSGITKWGIANYSLK